MNAYIRYLHLIEALKDQPTQVESIDETAKHLLNVIALSHANGKKLTVTDAMSFNSVASPATIHRKIDMLVAHGLIEQVFEGKNRRTKYLVPTKRADDYFENLGNALTQALAVK